MPDIDVTDVLLDSEVAGEEFTYTRRPETVTPAGRGVRATQVYPAFGSIQPVEDNSMMRTEDFDAAANTIQIVTITRLRGASQDQGGNQFAPDIVTWKGNEYVVKTVEDFSQYGAGYILAVATSEDFVDQASG